MGKPILNMKVTSIFKQIREQLFGKSPQARASGTPVSAVPVQGNPPPATKKSPTGSGYFVQIGFDFGTAFSKCVYRDVLLDKAWVHMHSCSKESEKPFLLPSAIRYCEGTLSHPGNTFGAYTDGCLHHIKMALEKAGKEEWDTPELLAYNQAAKAHGIRLQNFVEACGIYFIGGALGEVLSEVKARFPDESTLTQGQIFVNMAVPVANIDHPGVNEIFDRVLRQAWVLSNKLTGFPETDITELMGIISETSSNAESAKVREACFIYPEVSANVQAFVRSRASREGIYLFSDTGAGTVDQSVFLFSRSDGKDKLTYLAARVMPLGSSQIELRAAAKSGKPDWQELENWRIFKESDQADPMLTDVRNEIKAELSEETYMTLGQSKQKLISPRQINELRVIFGGGGHSRIPYRDSIITQFDNGFFDSIKIGRRRLMGDPFDIGMPAPVDLEMPPGGSRWMDRLTVAYGLSFEQGQLADFTLPTQVQNPTSEEIWKPRRNHPEAPSKDNC